MSSTITVERYHDISCGHRVSGHESKCAHLHGHNYRVTFICRAESKWVPVDNLGRVIDFSVVKSKLCMWVEENWDHKFLAWEKDVLMKLIRNSVRDLSGGPQDFGLAMLDASLVWTPFNPTAENMAQHLLHVIGPQQLEGTAVILTKVIVEETRKCSAVAELGRVTI